MPKQILILGLGNDILTDDAVGLLVARKLRVAFADTPSVDVRETTEMGLALLDYISGYDTVFLVDSIQTSDGKPGQLHELNPAELRAIAGLTPHFLGVKETVELGRKLEMPMPATVRIFAIEVVDPYTLGTGLSPELEAALTEITPRIASIIRRAIG